ncbi:amino acid ABC transporter ATP-binding protein, PAAT family (TC 3.A.1.3.-) [Arthrobacter sp. 49Tsu3.1M3]|uniref:amino acid ABC transporter ATP-binding protein n=1 Tax=Arthrobacter sp. 49Tsu3.1M3 TaxID=1279029 RepID=UPI0009CD7C5B|nr:amino acid ABC transporter ATP-binding protein [Arthrobacter sp. 49Tsu3.1M3]SKB43777.1 amino acid ABC transporter ATP-binding protein, PAAT family (TC 3.A.1.3.-) [Arthrobacter sp. 49Tsu3.1M3]
MEIFPFFISTHARTVLITTGVELGRSEREDFEREGAVKATDPAEDKLVATAGVPAKGSGIAAEARNVIVDFHGHKAVNGVDLKLARGEVVALIGPSGSGKSTLLRTFNHLQEPTSGEILIGGKPTTGANRADLLALRRKVGMCFQSFNLFPHLTALENIELAQVHALGRSRKEAKERGRDLLKRVGLESKADQKPANCSGGQQQRIAIARALALDPEIILFDEPTSALDPELGVEVLNVMRELAESGMTMMVATHEMHFAEDVADRVIFMADGQILESGEPSVVLRTPQHARTQKFLQAVIGR